ncbi:MAG: TonB family protein [Thermodesulfobacteriota bacterium]|nr:TonB family protein [Thermodesulfobacteriota bacterium]
MGLHVLIFGLLVFMTGYAGCDKKAFSSDVITVDLAALPASVPALSGGRSESQKTAQPLPSEEVKAPAFKKPEKPATPIGGKKEKPGKPALKTSLKKKTFDPDRTVEDALEDLARKVAEKKPEQDRLSEALSRLDKTVQEKQRRIKVSGTPSTGNVSGGGGRGDTRAINLYKLEIRYRILKNWVYPRQIAGADEDLKAVIGIHIAKSGRLLDVWFDKRSGNEYYDESARKAVLKSEPLPPLPKGYDSYKVGLEFTPSDRR